MNRFAIALGRALVMVLPIAVTSLILAGCALLGGDRSTTLSSRPPIIFVHGNGDTAGVWITTAWRFESNGWPRERLFALDLTNPLAQDSEGTPQAGRSSEADFAAALAALVDQVRRVTGAPKVILIGSSRGGYPIRSYIRDTGGATVSAAILCGTPNHGVWTGDYNPGSEFNGAGPFLKDLNASSVPGGAEVTPGVRFLTLRSDNNDKYAQPTGEWLGKPELVTHTNSDGPALRGAENIVLPGADHRQTAFSAAAFRAQFRFLTGSDPEHLEIIPEARVALTGKISGLRGTEVTNVALPGARIEVFLVDPSDGLRTGPPVYDATVDKEGRFGPVTGGPNATYEFVIHAEGYAITHIYRGSFLRSSSWVNLHPLHFVAGDHEAQSVIIATRPRGYFGLARDRMSLDGKPLPGVAPGVPGVATVKAKISAKPHDPMRAVEAVLNDERLAVQSWPTASEHLVVAEFQY